MKNKWLMKFKQKHVMHTDKTDTPITVSVLSVPTPNTFGRNNIIIEENIAQVRTDKTDTVKIKSVINQQLSVLSVHTNGYWEKKDRLNSQETPLNRTDRTDIMDQYEERVAIVEYDGGQNACQAHRIAYQDALIAELNAKPPDDRLKVDTDWLAPRIKAAQDFLITQGIKQPK